MRALTLSRAVTQTECPWLARDFAIGEVVYKYDGHTYGCITHSGEAFTEQPGQLPFFELPYNAINWR